MMKKRDKGFREKGPSWGGIVKEETLQETLPQVG